MNTLKNFFIGLFVIAMSFVIFLIVIFTWPLIIGITSIVLTILAFILFVMLIFYIIVLVGQITSNLINKRQ